jgi:branched chain amino acid efflux pump
MSGAEPATFGAISAILVMAAAAHLLRVGGFWLMGRLPLTPRVRRMLDALPGSVVAAAIVPTVAQAGIPAALAIGAVVVIMAARRNEFLAVSGGIAAVVLGRAAGL